MDSNELIKLILPLIIIQFILLTLAMIDWYKQGEEFRKKRWWWVPIILFVNMIGPVLYFVLGRRDN